MSAELRIGEALIRWAPDGSGVRVETTRNVYHAQVLVISTGPWISKHIPQLSVDSSFFHIVLDRIQGCCSVERQVIGFYESKPPDLFAPDRMPCFIKVYNDGKMDSYGLPAYKDQGNFILESNPRKGNGRRDEDKQSWSPE